MKISLEWVRDYVALPKDADAHHVADRLTMSTVEVEQVADLARPFANVVVAEIRSVTSHPNAPHLSICEVNCGGDFRHVVCGATNVTVGMKVALAREGAVVRTADGTERTIQPVMIRGIESDGMLCAPSELGLQNVLPAGPTEILDLSGVAAAVGTPLATAIGYDDVVLEIDNKSLTNRPDLWGHHGVAREIAAIFDLPFSGPPKFGVLPPKLGFDVKIEAPELCARYTATRLRDVKATSSPAWIQARLAKLGQRPINLLVDLTNYVMFATGQPLHVFDARDIASRITIRCARPDDHLKLLDGTAVDLTGDTLVIADDQVPVALAGIMGGYLGVREDTTDVFLEAANFSPLSVRRTARRLGLRTESSVRFEKGIDIERIDLAVQMFLALLVELQPGARVVEHVDATVSKPAPIAITVPVEFLQRKIGLALSAEAMRSHLQRLQFGCSIDGEVLHVAVPSWRSTGDVSLPEDIVEEVARLYGYDNLPFTPPIVRLERPIIQVRRRMERRVREYLAFRAGMREIVSYPWVEREALDAAGIPETQTLGLSTPPGDGFRLAPSLVPHMLVNVAANLRNLSDFCIFELSRVFSPRRTETAGDSEALPEQPLHAVAAFVGSDAETVFLRAKGVLEMLARTVQVAPLAFSQDVEVAWGDRIARLAITSDGKTIGALAVVSSRAKRLAGIRRGDIALFEMNVDALTPLPSRDNAPTQLPMYPEVEHDISMIVDLGVSWAAARSTASGADDMVRSVRFIDQYAGSQIPSGKKSLTIRLRIGSDDGTLAREAIERTAANVTAALRARLGAQIRDQ